MNDNVKSPVNIDAKPSQGQMGENIGKLDPLKAKVPANPNAKFSVQNLLDGAAEIGYRQCKHDIIETLIGIHDSTDPNETVNMRAAIKRIVSILATVR